jgi:hypothetical protein
VEAAALDQRAQQMRARQDLRRRVGLMEHDPFSPIEGSKRRVIAGAATTHAPSSTSDSSGPNPPTINPGIGGASGATFTPGMTGSTAPGGGSTPVQTTTGGARGAVAPPAAPTPSGGSSAGDNGTPLSVQLRDVLDPATLGELRRLESSGAPRAGVEAMERAAAALKARADKLQAQSQSLRAHAHDPR